MRDQDLAVGDEGTKHCAPRPPKPRSASRLGHSISGFTRSSRAEEPRHSAAKDRTFKTVRPNQGTLTDESKRLESHVWRLEQVIV